MIRRNFIKTLSTGVAGAGLLGATSSFSEINAQTEPRPIRLSKIKGRYWLVDGDGFPFFAHGITHSNNSSAKLDLAAFSKACKEAGFNSYGYGCPTQLRSDMPFVESWSHLVKSAYYRGKNNVTFVDIFDPAEQAKLETGVKLTCYRSRNDRDNIIGHCWTDLGSWPLENPSGTNWVEFIRNLPADSPGQKTYQEFLSSWKGEDEKARDQAFLRLIAREYFRVVGEATRKYDPGRLIFGDRFGFNTFDIDVVEEMLPYVDAIAIQPPFQGGFPKQKFNEIHRLTGKPIILCDFAVRFKDGDKDIRSWKPADNSVEAGIQYAEYIRATLDTNYIIGAFWCNPIDTPKGFDKPGVKQGFFGEGMSKRPGLTDAVKEVNAYREKITPKTGKL
tara:strand:+ start:6829 stop:7995 length:1167 start_codon:yes stop_codon:yes gene_type:complete